tara:strand:- start:14675 stop:15376 length:702 start_codon:yes stop_codon:yes gene_type:complete
VSEELDDDLKELLDQLDERDEFLPTDDELLSGQDEPDEPTEPDEPEPKITKKTKKPAKKPVVDDPDEEDPVIKAFTGDEGKPLRPIDELAEIRDQRRFDGSESAISNALATASEPIEISRYLEKMDEVSEEVLQACRSDRAEAQDVINMLRAQCDAAHSKNVFPARMYVDGLVKAVEVKANINTNAVKVMEGVAKMIAATKAGTNIQNNTLQVTGAELDELLSGQGPNSMELD